MNHKMRFVLLFASLATALVLIGLGAAVLHTESVAVAQTGTMRRGIALSIEQEAGLTAPTAITAGLVTDGPMVEDGSFNELSYQGILRAESELGITYHVYTSASEADYLPNLEQCAADGADLCFGVGFSMADAISQTAILHPGTSFALIDHAWENQPPNLRGMTFASDQAGYLAGTLAALMSDSHVVGAVGGMAIPSVTAFVNAYHNAAQCADPSTTVIITYTGTFVDPDLGAQTAQEQMLLGADVIFGVGGATGNGAILTATQSGVWGIGVDSDQYNTLFDSGAVPGSDRLLSSAMKRLDNAVFDTISDVISGTFTSGTALYTVAEDGVGLAPFHETDPLIPESVRSRISGVEQGLREGWLTVDGPCVATIGVAADLSGPVAELGWQEANAVQLAISQTNAMGGLNLGGVNYTLHIALADDACDATQAITAAQTLLDTGALAVVGHTCSPASMAAQALYAAADVPMISPSSTNPDVTQQGYNTTFRVIAHDGSPPTTLATYLRQWSGYERSAFVATEGYYQWALDFYSSTFTALGGTITGYHLVTDTADFYDVLADIKHNEQPDVIFYADNDPTRAGLFSQTAHEVGMNDVPIAWSSWDNAASLLGTYADAAGLAAEGDFVMMHYRPFWAMPGWEVFRTDYQAAGFPNAPDDPGTMGAYAYDAARILLGALDRADTPGGARDAVAVTTNYGGVVGLYEGFDSYGDVIPQWGWIERHRAGQWTPVYAIPEFSTEIHVCDSGCDYTTIQDAVDAASDGDIIKVAAGTYSDLHTHVAPPNYDGDVVTLTQVVYVDKSLTLRGGYMTTDWVMPDLLNNVTVLDAQGDGRVFVVAGFITPTIEGFHITGGDASGLRGSERAQDSTDAGGGVFVIHAPGTTLRNCQIYANTAQQGGGIYLDRVPALIYENNIYLNTGNYGGGATLWCSNATLIDNTISGNTVTQVGAPGPPEAFASAGGGLEVANDGNVHSYPTIMGNAITGNSADRRGGGLALGAHVHATIHQNTISANTAITGGGLYMAEDEATLEDNLIRENIADIGGGIYLYASDAWIQNNQVLSNTANFHSAGVHMYCTSDSENTAAALFGNKVLYNVAGDSGGGIGTEFCPEGAIKWNTITDNEAPWGAGLNIFVSNLIIDSNFIADNVAADAGGGVLFHGPGDPKVVNNVIVRNHANQYGGAVMMIGAYPQIVHTTFSENTSGDGSAIYIQDWDVGIPPYSDAYFENVILADSAVGIKVTQGSTVTVAGILWYNVPLTVTQSQTASVTIAQQITGDPAFVDPANDDYHIGPTSVAINQGIDGGLDYDFEEQIRPMGQGYDLGADEYPGAHLSPHVATPAVVVLPGQTFTYDVALANDGALTATNTLLTFTLDPQQRAAGVTPSGVCTINGDWGGDIVCPLGDMPPGAEVAFVVTAQVAATVPLGQEMESAAEATADATLSGLVGIKTVSRARLVYPLNYEPGSLDVNREASDLNSLTLLAQLMEAPYRYGTNGSLIPAGATGYTVSPDGLVYTVTLRTDALWSDGVPVTAQHYADSVIRMLDPATGAGYAFVLYPIQGAWEFNSGTTTDPATVGVAAVNAHTLRFTLHNPAAFFPSVLATSAMYPVRLDAMGTLPFVGNGPYVLTEWESGRYFILDKNLQYHNAAQVITSRIVLPIIPETEQVAAYEAGVLDVSTAPGDALDYIRNDPVLSNELRNVPWPGLYYLGLNTVLTPTNNLNVRMALASAIDREALMNSLNTPWRETATSVIPPGIPGYQNGAVGYIYNPTQAQAYLAAAGYPGGAGFPGIELWAYPGTEAIIEAIADDWQTTLNISVTVVYIDRWMYYSELGACRGTPGECSYNVYRAGWWLDYADANNTLNDLFHPDSGSQYTYWDSAYYRQLMDLQLVETNPTTRIAHLQEADRVLVEYDTVIVPIYYLDRPFLIKPNVTYEYPSIGGPRLMAWRTSGTASPCYVRVSSLPGITYNDVQTAIDAAQPGDTLKVAGTCATVHSRSRRDLTTTGVVTQVAYINKSLTLQGGYTTTNWLNPDPLANPTTLDALEQGRVVYVTGNVNVTLGGFSITGGDAVGQGGSPWNGEDAGGGVYIITATVTLRKNQIFGNIANGGGGGAYLHYSPSTLESNTFTQNQGRFGGGVYLYASAAILKKNTLTANTVTNSGGGLYLYQSTVRVENNRIHNNVSVVMGGGVSVYGGDPIANGNLVYGNSAGYGGGLGLTRTGGWWANNVIVDNHADTEGGGIYALGATAQLVHSTIARNSGGSGVGLYVTEHTASGVFSTMMLTNTILVDHSIGISVTGGNALMADTVLWHNTPLVVSQSPTAVVTILNDWTADPRFAADGYHLRIGSPALDAGLPSALTRDVDGDPRPYGSGFDIGADEAPYVQVPPETGATLVYTDTDGNETTLVVPPDVVTETTTIVLTQLEPETLPTPPEFVAGGIALELDAYQGDEPVENFTFSAPVTLTLEYTDEDIAGIEEASFMLHRYVCPHPESLLLCFWEVIGTRPGEGQVLDMDNNVLTAWLLGFTRFRGMGEGLEPAFEVSKAYSSNRVAGTPVTYTVTVVNTGDADATAVNLEDSVPEYLTWTSGGTLALNRVHWYLEAITASGGTGVGQFSAVLPCTASLTIVNDDYRVVGSAQGVTSTVGPPVSFDVISPTMIVGIDYTPSAPVVGDTVTFTAVATTNGTPLGYAWSFGATGQSAARTYSEAGTYTVTLTATDACGYSQVAAVPVTVLPPGYAVYLPLIMRQ